MANSGELSSRNYTARQMLEEASYRAGIPAAALTAELVQRSYDLFNLLLSELPARGIQLWTREKIILPLYENTAPVPTPNGTNSILSVNRRTLTRLNNTTNINTSSAGGTVANAFDDNFSTVCTQTAINGNIQTQFTTATQVLTVGLLMGVTAAFSFSFEYSDDAISWTVLYFTNATDSFVDKTWYWYDLVGAPTALYWRVRATGVTPMALRELYWGNNPSEIPLGQYNLDDYNDLPNKNFQGQVVQYYQDRQRTGPTLYVWPVCGSSWHYDHLVCYRQRYLYDVTRISQDVDIPQRWNEALTAMMARRICRSFPEAKFERYTLLKGEEIEAVSIITAEERDNSPVNYNPGIYVYTR